MRLQVLGLEQAPEPIEVLAELLFGAAGHDPRRESGQHPRIAFADHRQAGAAAARLERVADREGNRAVERLDREDARPLLLLDPERRVELATEQMPRFEDPIALAARGMDARLPRRQIRDIGE